MNKIFFLVSSITILAAAFGSANGMQLSNNQNEATITPAVQPIRTQPAINNSLFLQQIELVKMDASYPVTTYRYTTEPNEENFSLLEPINLLHHPNNFPSTF